MLSRSHYRLSAELLQKKVAEISRMGHLSLEQSLLIAASSACATGHGDTTRTVLRLARSQGVSYDRLYEAILQTYLFAGYPRAINALTELRATFPDAPTGSIQLEAETASMESWVKKGVDLCGQVYGTEYPKLLDFMATVSVDLGRWMVVEGYGKVLSRRGLTSTEREMCALGALLTLHTPPQLRAHLRGCINVGASRKQIETAVALAGLFVPEEIEIARGLLRDMFKGEH